MEVYLCGAETLGCVVWPGASIAYSQGIPPNFYPPHISVRPSVPLLPPLPPCTAPHPLFPGSATALLLPVWMNVASLNPWLSDFHTA